jgi:hypothetical protein
LNGQALSGLRGQGPPGCGAPPDPFSVEYGLMMFDDATDMYKSSQLG